MVDAAGKVFGANLMKEGVERMVRGLPQETLGVLASWRETRMETNQAAFVEAVSRTHPQVKIRVNLDPGVVACREPERIYRAIDRVLAIAGGRPNCVMGTGALPYETPPENMRLIREDLEIRQATARSAQARRQLALPQIRP